MLMKWSDLEPGDVIRIREEVKEHYKSLVYWTQTWCDRDLIIYKVELGRNYIRIFVGENNRDMFSIHRDGRSVWDETKDLILFDIIKLRDE